MDKKKQNQKKDQVMNSVDKIINQPPSKSDPQGMYTGKPLNTNERPEQDADDL